jgi:hypothetical protein
MSKEVSNMIRDLLQMVEKELDVKLPAASAHRVESALCLQYGGERVYVPKMPKRVNQVRLVELGTASSILDRALTLGVTTRRVRQLLKGR